MGELMLELGVNLVGGLLELIGEALLEVTSSDTTANRIFWCIVLVILSGIICWEVR